MLSPISDTGHLLRPRRRQPKVEFALILLNVGAYALACASLLTTLG